MSDGHWSDCAVHNEPAYPAGPCNCGGLAANLRVGDTITIDLWKHRPWWAFWHKREPLFEPKQFRVTWTAASGGFGE